MSTIESAAALQKTIVLMSSDRELFYVEELVACECETIKHMIEDDCADATIPLPNVSSKILAKVIEYCKRHAHHAASASVSEPGLLPGQNVCEEDLKKFDSELVNVDQATLIHLILAANYLNVKKLLDLTCQTMADMIKDKMPEEIRTIFNIVNDYTPEEEEEIRKEHSWAFE